MKESKTVATLAALHAVIVSVLILLFLWPAGGSAAKDLPIGLVGPAEQTSQIAAAIESQQPGALEITQFTSAEEAQDSIEAKEIYGALVLGQQPEVMIASAGNPAGAQLLRELGQNLANQSAQMQGMQLPTIQVTDLAPLPESDQRGAVFGSSALPLVIGGISLGALAVLRIRSGSGRLALASIASLVTGTIAAAIVSGVFGALPGDLLANSMAFSAVIAAISLTLIGMHAIIGMAGFGLTAATLFLVGNPLNGVALPVEFYPGIWGAIGQAMPVGAGFELLKKINFFEAADQSAQWWVLAAWILVGLTLSIRLFFKKS
ncbi:MAG: SNG1 family protein [Aquiluna sp.]|nr:SNG1 family protein [Aquiluna sp.]MCF8545746.1 SNG1 family protein [Aquiluna sp.]